MTSFYTQNLFYKKPLGRKHLLTVNFCTMKLLHREALLRRRFFNTEASTQRNHCTEQLSHTQKLLRREASTRSSFHTHTQKHICRKAFTRSSFNTQMIVHKKRLLHTTLQHTEDFTQNSFCTEKFLHAETST